MALEDSNVAPQQDSGSDQQSGPQTAPGPNAAPVSDAASVQSQMAPFAAKQQAELQKASDSASQPLPPTGYTGPHARLLSMIQGLSIGMSNFGKAAATGGREGGASGVIADEGAIAQQKINAQNAALAQKNAETQQHIMAANIAEKQMNNIMLMHTIPHDMTMQDLKEKSEQQGVAKGGLDLQEKAQDMFDTKGQVPAGWTVDANTGQVSQSGQGQPPASGAAPSGPTSGQSTSSPGAPSVPGATPTGTVAPMSSIFNTRQNMLLDAAGQELKDAKGNDDPLVTAARQIVANPNSTPVQKRQAVIAVQNKAGLSADVVKNLTAKADLAAKQQTTDPLYKMETDPSQMEGAKSSSAISLLTNRLSTETDPAQKSRVTRLLAQANNSHAAWQADERSKENAHLAAISGDSVSNGQLLAEGDLTLADLKSRGTTTKSITDSVKAAKAYADAHGKTYNASDEILGEQALKGQTNQNFYGSARSLVQQGGMLDQLKIAHDNLGNTKIPGFNKIANWTAYQAGTPELSAYKQAVLAAADDYAKVMGGGNPTIEQFNALRDGFAYQLNNSQLDSAVGVARNSVRSQVEGRIGPNNYIRKRMGDILHDDQPAVAGTQPAAKAAPATPGSPASKIHANMGDFKQISPTKEHGNLYTDDGKIWYTSDGTIYGGK